LRRRKGAFAVAELSLLEISGHVTIAFRRSFFDFMRVLMAAGGKFTIRNSDVPFGAEWSIIVKFAGFDEAKRLALREFGASSVILDHAPLSEKELSAFKMSGLTHKLSTPSFYEKSRPLTRLR
jgi:hypothetical protein